MMAVVESEAIAFGSHQRTTELRLPVFWQMG
jgi:hypothetical protein